MSGEPRTWAVLVGDDVYEWVATEEQARARVRELNEFSARPMTPVEMEKWGTAP